jgi:hypothetical protein
MKCFKDPVELDPMRTLRYALDPDGLMKAGTRIPAEVRNLPMRPLHADSFVDTRA